MNTHKLLNPYANLTLRRQLFLESRAMAEFALSKGKQVPVEAIHTIEKIESNIATIKVTKSTVTDPKKQSLDSAVDSDVVYPDAIAEGTAEGIDIEHLVATHAVLTEIVAPATPKTILLLDMEQEKGGLLRFFGLVGLVRKMMLVAVVSIVIFILIPSTGLLNSTSITYFFTGGIAAAMNLLFFLSAATLGASFSALYTANTFITNGTFDPTHSASYWIRLMLGLISGLILPIFVSSDAVQGGSSFFNSELIGPLLALLGGFSADLFFTFLNRMVETMKSLFTGSVKAMVASKAEEARIQLEGTTLRGRMELAGDLLKMQQELGKISDSEQMQEHLNNMIGSLLPKKGAADAFKQQERKAE